MVVSRGDVVLVSIPQQEKSRPAVILTANWLNRYALDVGVVPVTSIPRRNFATRVELPAGEGGLKKTSWAKCDQVTTIPKTLILGQVLGRVSTNKMKEIEAGVRLALALSESGGA